MTTPLHRSALLLRGERLALVTIAYNGLEGVIAIVAGWVAGSVALTGFGVDSAIEVTSAAIVGWRLRRERRGVATGDTGQIEAIEQRAARFAGMLLLVLAAYLTVESVRRLTGSGERPETSAVGLALTGLSILLMPLLARAKLRTAESLGSRALRADAYETIACVWLSVATFTGLAVNAWFGWWWADPSAALVLVPMIAREGLEAWRGECCVSGGVEHCPAEEREPN